MAKKIIFKFIRKINNHNSQFTQISKILILQQGERDSKYQEKGIKVNCFTIMTSVTDCYIFHQNTTINSIFFK